MRNATSRSALAGFRTTRLPSTTVRVRDDGSHRPRTTAILTSPVAAGAGRAPAALCIFRRQVVQLPANTNIVFVDGGITT